MSDIQNWLHDYTEIGQCDCGATYDPASRFDHDADTGECWDCSERSLTTMTDDEQVAYLQGA
jgi:hypothetical protein